MKPETRILNREAAAAFIEHARAFTGAGRISWRRIDDHHWSVTAPSATWSMYHTVRPQEEQ